MSAVIAVLPTSNPVAPCQRKKPSAPAATSRPVPSRPSARPGRQPVTANAAQVTPISTRSPKRLARSTGKSPPTFGNATLHERAPDERGADGRHPEGADGGVEYEAGVSRRTRARTSRTMPTRHAG